MAPPKAEEMNSSVAASRGAPSRVRRTACVAAKERKRNMKVPQNSAMAATTSFLNGCDMPKVLVRSTGSSVIPAPTPPGPAAAVDGPGG